MNWIKCSDQEPTETGQYLVCSEDRVVSLGYFFSEPTSFGLDGWSKDNIKWWAKMPEPPDSD
ncbi:MAG: hypothetical protein HQL70_10760 [Magnetococcales bacterium]|nr:hypothetical protein [Magnetococcales bacterium]